jgi:arylsulfatase A-like enzyme
MANLTRRQLLAGLPLLAFQAGRTRQNPNIILCLIDDLGWTDLGCFGSDYYRTPNIDRFSAQSMKFTDAHSACTVCSPSRAGIMTGKYPARLHITDYIPGEQHPYAKLKVPDWTQHLPLEERTMAEMLKPLGYRTQHIGKWHLGNEPFYPEQDNRVELYNLAQDISETQDLACSDPDRAKRMKQRLEDWRRSVGAQMALPNPNYDPARDRAVLGQREAELAD